MLKRERVPLFNRLRERLTFSKPKGPGYGIQSGFYMSVLTGIAHLPTLKAFVNPKGENGAIPGFAVPLRGEDKSELEHPILRGTYAVASLDRKTVLKMLVMSTDESGFDPAPFLSSKAGQGLDPQVADRLRGAWHVIQFTFESYDPDVGPAVSFLLDVTEKLAQLTDGVVADPLSQVYRLPGVHADFPHPELGYRVLDVLQVKLNAGSGGLEIQTLGMQKFSLAELMFRDITPVAAEAATQYLLGLGMGVLKNGPMQPGSLVWESGFAFMLTESGIQPGVNGGVLTYELLPQKGHDTSQVLLDWQKQLS